MKKAGPFLTLPFFETGKPLARFSPCHMSGTRILSLTIALICRFISCQYFRKVPDRERITVAF